MSAPMKMIRARVEPTTFGLLSEYAEMEGVTLAEYVRSALRAHIETVEQGLSAKRTRTQDATVAFDPDYPLHWRSVIEWSGAHPALFRKYTGGRDAALHDDRYSVMTFAHTAGWRP